MGKMAQIIQISISKNFKSSESYDNFQKVVNHGIFGNIVQSNHGSHVFAK
jgi:hypothetical protein